MNRVNPYGVKWFKRSFLAVIIAIFIAIDVQAATLRSTQVTNSNAVPPTMNAPNIEGGAVRRARGVYSFTGSEASADVIEMVNIPSGSIIVRHLSTISWEDLGTTVTMEVGDTFDPNRYCTSLVGGTASKFGTMTTLLESIALGGTYTHNIVGTSTSDDTVDITLTTVSTGLTGVEVHMEVVYVSGG